MDGEQMPPAKAGWDVVTLVVHVLLPAVIVSVLVFIVPKFVAVFADLGVALPGVTVLLLNVATLMRRLSILAVLVVTIAVAVDYGVWGILRRNLGEGAAKAWSLFVVVCYIVYLGFMVIALFLPLIETVNTMGAPSSGS